MIGNAVLELRMSSPFALKVRNRMPTLFIVWLVLTVLAPHQDLYKVFFHGIVIPAILVLLFKRCTGISWRDPLLVVTLLFAGYAAITTFIIGIGPLANHLRALRWSVEVAFCMLALYIWMPEVVKRPLWWGRIFLSLSLLGALGGIVLFIFIQDGEGRLSGLGALHNPIQAGSILMIYFAIGHFLLYRSGSAWLAKDKLLLVGSLVTVLLAVLLSESRAPIAAFIIYLVFLALMQLYRKPSLKDALVVGAGLVIAVGTVISLYGVDGYVSELMQRGLSYRLIIWRGYFEYPPASWLLGYGAGTYPMHLEAARHLWEPIGLNVTHAHNLFLGTLTETGIIGLAFLLSLIGLILARVIRCIPNWEERFLILGILGLIFMLTLTGSHTLLSSIKAIWLFAWIPLVFIWFWSRTFPQTD